MRRVVAIGLIALLGCEPTEICNLNGELTARPQLCLDRASLDWGSGDFGRGVLVGMSKLDTIGIQNGGRELLRFSSLSIDGPAFSIRDQPAPELRGGESVYVTIVFAPPEPGFLQGRLNIESNAQNFPIRTIELHACGETRDGGFTCDR